jgi:hypothetical protein
VADDALATQRIPYDKVARTLRRAVLLDKRDPLARARHELVEEVLWVCEGGRAADDLHARVVVDCTDAEQAADDARDVRPEHAAVHVRLVDDERLDGPKDARPAVVVGQDCDMQHVRIGEDDVRGRAH